MTDEKKGIWNGGSTNISRKEAKIFRQMEDSYDLVDSEIQFRTELQERERLMKEEAKQIESKYQLSDDSNTKPLHELYQDIEYQDIEYQDIDYSEKTRISGIGGVGGPISSLKAKDLKE